MQGFKNGIHPSDRKNLTGNKKIEIFSAPETLYIPLLQHIGMPCTALVKEGDAVKAGQLIGTNDKALSSNIYCSVSGTVTGFKNLPTAAGGQWQHIIIKNDFKYEEINLPPLDNPSPEEILARIKEAGIVGMGGASFPTYVKLSPPKAKKIDTLIINGAECEPYITCDYRIMLEYTQELVKGIKLIAETLGITNIFIGIEDNKPAAIEKLKGIEGIKVIPLKTKYPQGAEKQLIYSITKRKVPLGGLPMDVGCVADNVHTAYSVYQAVYEGKPSYQRIVTVSGKAVEKSGNYIIRTGTPYSFIAETCGLKSQPAKVISGGPMMGFSVFNLDMVVNKATSSILFLTQDEINTAPAETCINCGRCARACPMFLMPMYIDSSTLTGDYKNAKRYGAADCIECGCCAYVCPAKRPLVQSIRLAKKIIREKKI